MNILVTGAAGFIGSNFVRMLVGRGEQAKIVALDKLTYAGNLANLQDLMKDPRLTFLRGDICDEQFIAKLFKEHRITHVVHFAAESHVDRSILSSGPFIQTNVVGTQVLLDAAKANSVERYLQVSTDEVYGTLPEDAACAQQPLQRQQGSRGLPGAVLLPHVPYAGADHALLEQLRALSLS